MRLDTSPSKITRPRVQERERGYVLELQLHCCGYVITISPECREMSLSIVAPVPIRSIPSDGGAAPSRLPFPSCSVLGWRYGSWLALGKTAYGLSAIGHPTREYLRPVYAREAGNEAVLAVSLCYELLKIGQRRTGQLCDCSMVEAALRPKAVDVSKDLNRQPGRVDTDATPSRLAHHQAASPASLRCSGR
jgi:hypothetical protein